MKQVISTNKAPAAIGPYSQAVKASGTFVFTAGSIPIDPDSGVIAGNSIEIQARQAITNLLAVLDASGSSAEEVVKTTVYLKNMNDFTAFNEVYAAFFGVSLPARSAVEVARLPKDVLVEIDAIALTS